MSLRRRWQSFYVQRIFNTIAIADCRCQAAVGNWNVCCRFISKWPNDSHLYQFNCDAGCCHKKKIIFGNCCVSSSSVGVGRSVHLELSSIRQAINYVKCHNDFRHISLVCIPSHRSSAFRVRCFFIRLISTQKLLFLFAFAANRLATTQHLCPPWEWVIESHGISTNNGSDRETNAQQICIHHSSDNIWWQVTWIDAESRTRRERDGAEIKRF